MSRNIIINNTPDIVAIEPGYYKDGHFGIRIENIVIVREAKTPNNFGDKGYLEFEHVTMASTLSQGLFTI